MLPCGIIAIAVLIEDTFRARVQSPQVWMLTVLIIKEGQSNYWPVLITVLVLQCHDSVSCHGYIMISVTLSPTVYEYRDCGHGYQIVTLSCLDED